MTEPQRPQASAALPHGTREASSQATPQRVQLGVDDASRGVRVWYDRGPLTSEWDAPTWWDWLPSKVKWLTAAVVGAAVGLGLWAAGGFEEDPGSVQHLPPGATLSSGPVEIRPEYAHWKLLESAGTWTVSVRGSCRLTEAETTTGFVTQLSRAVAIGAPKFGDQPWVIGRETRVQFGVHGYRNGVERTALVPGQDFMPCSVEATVPASTKPTSHVRLLAWQLTYQESNDVQTGGSGWKVDTTHGAMIDVPAVQEPGQRR